MNPGRVILTVVLFAALTVANQGSSVMPSSAAEPATGSSESSRPVVQMAEEMAARPKSPSDLTRLDRRIGRIAAGVRSLESIAADLRVWFGCVRLFPVDQIGDADHRWGFLYDERDGSGLDTRTALVRHTGGSRPDLALLRMSRRAECLSAAPDPNGTGDDARTSASAKSAFGRAIQKTGASLERRLARLEERIERLEDKFDRFDEWESCLSWLPVTQYGDESQNLGYLFDASAGGPAGGSSEQRHVGALDIDSSEWDDPDYMFLAFLGRDRPFTNVECGHEPGESVDRAVPAGSRLTATRSRANGASGLEDLQGDVAEALEDVEDLWEPGEEFVQFDECMFTIGVRELGSTSHGYRFKAPHGAPRYQAALSFDLSDLRLPQMDLMGFPGEEPPQIECNEDAGGHDTDE